MQFRVIVRIIVLASIAAAQGLPLGELELATVSEYEPAEVRREKRTLTTICVEIKPSSPYEEPYFMCKGTDMPQFSKGVSYGSSGGHSSGYSSKPSYKPKPSGSYGESGAYQSGGKSDYYGPVKSGYHAEHSKYDKPSAYESQPDYSAPPKPSYFDHESHSEYSSYEAPKSSYGGKPSYTSHDSHDDYSKPSAHKPTYEKPSAHYEPAHSHKPQSYIHEKPSYDHSESSEYSKPSSYESKPSYSEGSHSKPSYGHSGSYNTQHDSKPAYSKPSSHSANPTFYEHSDHSSYGHSKAPYSEQSPAKPYSKSSKPAYSPDEHGKLVKPYTGSEKGYGQAISKPVYSLHSQNYRAMSEDLMQPLWGVQQQGEPVEGPGYRSLETPLEYHNVEAQRVMNQDLTQQQHTGLDGPVKFDLERNAPTLQAAYPSSASYSPVIPSYSQAAPSYAAAAPSYAPALPAYTPAFPSYSTASPSYSPVSAPYASTAPSYAPVAPSYAPVASPYGSAPAYAHGSAIQSYVHPAHVYKPVCPQTYLYSIQPAIVALPCLSSQPSSGQPDYSQPLGTTPNLNLGDSHQFYPANINPLQDHGIARSDGNSESGKHEENNSTSMESDESDKKQVAEGETSQATPKKLDSLKKPELAEEKPAEKKIQTQDGAEKSNDAESNVGTGSKGAEGSDTKVAYDAMIRMAKIAAQLNKDDSNQGGDAGSTVPGSDKPSGHLQQFSRQK